MNEKHSSLFMAALVAALAGAPGGAADDEWCYHKPKAEEQSACIRECTSAGKDGLACVEECPLEYEESCTAACEHPYPCGDEWPDALAGPFELKEVVHDYITSHDGTELEVWVGLPDLPEGVRAPVVLSFSPYYNFCSSSPLSAFCTGSPDDDGWWQDPDRVGTTELPWGSSHFGLPPIRLLRRGYAVASVAMRGTADSSGCYDAAGKKSQLDTAVAVEWLAGRSWSNGRVGMTGLSYPAMMAFIAAAEAPPSLKAVLGAGVYTDEYTGMATAQGAFRTLVPYANVALYTNGSLNPPLFARPNFSPPPPELMTAWANRVPERVCDDLVEVTAEPFRAQLGDVRDADFWAERRHISRFHRVTAATMNMPGLLDRPSGPATQTDETWRALVNAPKRRVEGQWAHQFPDYERYPELSPVLHPGREHDTYEGIYFSWMDFWLKGIGPVPEGLDQVDYQDTSVGTWRTTAAWPPAEARTETLYLTGEQLGPMPGSGSRTFLSSPNPLSNSNIAAFFGVDAGTSPVLCPVAPLTPPDGLMYATAPAAADALVAGNPFLDLQLVSDTRGGVFTAWLLDLHSDFACDATGHPTGFEMIASGAADLRFHAGNMIAEDFPVGEMTRVRVDLHHLAHVIRAGHRLAVVLTYGDGAVGWTGQPRYVPTLQVNAAGDVAGSHLVLPVVEGTFGGSDPGLIYPPRPFAPES